MCLAACRWELVKENTVGEDVFRQAAESSDYTTDDGEEDDD